MTHANADVIRAIEDERGEVLDDDFARMIFAESLLVWSPVYGKLRLGGSIVHFDLHVDLGVGVVDSQTSRGAAGVVGFGIKLFVGQAVAFRIDARNHVSARSCSTSASSSTTRGHRRPVAVPAVQQLSGHAPTP